MSSIESTAENLSLIIAIAHEELVASGMDDEKASDLAVKICDHIRKVCGGAHFYIPKGIALDAALKYNRIWEDFKGNNYEALAKKYDLTVQRIYQITSAMQKVKQKESQKDLFE